LVFELSFELALLLGQSGLVPLLLHGSLLLADLSLDFALLLPSSHLITSLLFIACPRLIILAGESVDHGLDTLFCLMALREADADFRIVLHQLALSLRGRALRHGVGQLGILKQYSD
jgi:hypothetical protein